MEVEYDQYKAKVINPARAIKDHKVSTELAKKCGTKQVEMQERIRHQTLQDVRTWLAAALA